MATTYEYAVLPFVEVVGICDATPMPPGSYLSDDMPVRAYRDLISRGFRWARTDRDFAVFERAIQAESPEP